MSGWFDCICYDECKDSDKRTKKDTESRQQIKESLLHKKKTKVERKWSKNISIVIIGAGHAGIHMALLLLQSGYQNVKILERSRKMGGRSYSIRNHELHTVHELGTCDIYHRDKELMHLLQEYDEKNELIAIDSNTECEVMEYNGSFGCKDWIQSQQKHSFPNVTQTADTQENVKMRYKELYERIFGFEYANNDEIHIPPQPDADGMKLINSSFLDFLITNGLELLIPHFMCALSFKGYGNLNEIPSFYALWMNKPITLWNSGHPYDNGAYILKHGMYSLFEKIVRQHSMDITYNVCLTEIDRHIAHKRRKIEVKYCLKPSKVSKRNKSKIHQDTTKTVSIECDILFIACDMTGIRASNDEEKDVFVNMDSFSLCCTLFECDMKHGTQSKAIQIWPRMLLQKNSHLFAVRNRSKLVFKRRYDEICKEKKLTKEKLVAFQFSNKARKNGSGQKFKSVLLNDLRGFGYDNIDILKQRVMRYFPKFNQYGINKGFPWKIQSEIQGKHKNTFYIGKSVCFDSVESELRYNIQLKQKLML